MKKYRVFDINWAIDDYWDCDTVAPDLPSEVTIAVQDDFNPLEEIADYISDDYGFCVSSCSFEEVT